MLITSEQGSSATSRVDVSAHGATAIAKERREANRESHSVRITLSARGWSESRSCSTQDLSESGLYVRLPATCGLSVGQRCEVGFEGNVDPTKPSSVAGETRYATVVRTDAIAPASGKQIGAGLRFDQPLFL